MTVSDRQIEMARAYGEKHGIEARDIDYLSRFRPEPLSWADAVVVVKAILAGHVVPVERGEGEDG